MPDIADAFSPTLVHSLSLSSRVSEGENFPISIGFAFSTELIKVWIYTALKLKAHHFFIQILFTSSTACAVLVA